MLQRPIFIRPSKGKWAEPNWRASPNTPQSPNPTNAAPPRPPAVRPPPPPPPPTPLYRSSRTLRRHPRLRRPGFPPFGAHFIFGPNQQEKKAVGWHRQRWRMPLGLIVSSLGRAMRRKRISSLDILSSKRAPRDYYKGKNCKPTGFHTRKGNSRVYTFSSSWSHSLWNLCFSVQNVNDCRSGLLDFDGYELN